MMNQSVRAAMLPTTDDEEEVEEGKEDDDPGPYHDNVRSVMFQSL